MNPEPEIEGGFSRKAVGWIVGIGAVSFVLALLLTAFGEDLFSKPSPQANSYSRSALGHRGLVELLQSLGVGAVSRRTPGSVGPGPTHPLIAAEPDPDVLEVSADRLADLRREARKRDAVLIVVLPKWTGEAHPAHPGWLRRVFLMPEPSLRSVLKAIDEPELENLTVVRTEGRVRPCSALWRSAASTGTVDFRANLSPAQLLAPAPGLEPEVLCGKSLLVARHQSADGPEIYLVSDPDLLNNHGLGRGDNAALVYEFLTHRLGAKGVIFDETIHGYRRAPGILAEAFRFPLLLAVLQTAVLLGVLLWAGMGRFGKPLPPPAALGSGRQVLIDSTARLLTYGGHAAESFGRYFHQTVRALAGHFGLPSDLPEGEVLDRLQRISRERRLGMDLHRLRQQADHPPSGAQAHDRALSFARDLHRWRQEMMDGNRTHP
ncbi:MAG TPA: DUF4350 domain-containing protein [Thermoanaerobaculia bacterium]|jgi:hypothetical protein|nr:DUF4350 domain-containing protein [Thermoanaerobaculia bacterium]